MEGSKSKLTFTANGKQYSVGNKYPHSTSLLEYIRSTGISTGTKGSCYEGGCGVCLVTVNYQDPITKKARSYSVNACSLPLYTCDGLDITTVEGLGNTRDGLHPIQERLAKYNGAQCGFCSPGQVMGMYGLLKNNTKPTMKEVEDVFDQTLCRCTGYRAILDAMKSFAVDAPASLQGKVIDIEEIDGKICSKTGKPCAESQQSCKDHQADRPLQIVTTDGQWLRPTSLDQLFDLLRQYKDQSYRLVFGNTGFGVLNGIAVSMYKTLIDIRQVHELYIVDLSPENKAILGANLSLTNLKELFETTTDQGLLYTRALADILHKTGGTAIRNMGSWAGNLMLKHLYRDFPSDVFTILEVSGAKVTIADECGNSSLYSLPDFLEVDMKGKVIVSMQLPKISRSDVIVRTFKTSARLQESHYYVSSGFNFHVDKNNKKLVKCRPSIVIQGISSSMIHATNTEDYLTSKKLSDPKVLKKALEILSKEIIPQSDGPLRSSGEFRKSLALGHFYKFVLGVCKDTANQRHVTGGLDLERPLMTGIQDYGTPDPALFPVSKPLMKFTAPNLTSGEVKFIDDQPVAAGDLVAAPLLSSRGNASIKSIDPSEALKMPGVIKFIQAKDIPGKNNWRPTSWYGDQISELFSSGRVDCAGQPLGIIVAENSVVAWEAMRKIKVEYTNIQPVIIDILDAIKQKSFGPVLGPHVKGDAEAVMATAPHRLKGTAQSGNQYHFHLESQGAVCTPNDVGGMDVKSSSQWLDTTQEAVAQVLGIPLSSVAVEIQRLGGGFGGKIFYSIPVAAMCAVAAYSVNRPVKLYFDLQSNMQFQGCRQGYFYEYEVGCDNDGKILAVIATGYSDLGWGFFPVEGMEHTERYIDAAYFCPNWKWTVQTCITHKPVGTAMRAPGSATAIFAMENILDHVATYLKKDHLEVRKLNLFQEGQVTLNKMKLERCLVSQVVNQLQEEIGYAQRKKKVDEFNKANRWRKRGLHLMPARYAMMYTDLLHNTSVIIYHGDGSVAVAHGAIDMGQGINTKVMQTCSFKLGIPVEKVRVVKSSTIINANSHFTGGSACSELVCNAVIKCCDILLERLAKVKATLTNPSWEELVGKAYFAGVNLSVQYWPDKPVDYYNCYTACCTEVELDVLTGQYQIVQVDYLYDCGISLNPELDMGQLEGAFSMGCGLFLLEEMKNDPATGQLLTDSTRDYKIPFTKDNPITMNAKFLRNAPHPVGVLGSKAVGESPVALGACPFFALKRAVEAARAETAQYGWFPFYAPATVEKLQQACLNHVTAYTL